MTSNDPRRHQEVNGHQQLPGHLPKAADRAFSAAAEALAETVGNAFQSMPAMMAQAVQLALLQTPVRTPQHVKCRTCVQTRIGWLQGNTEALQLAQEAQTAEQADWAPDDPRRASKGLLAYLDPELAATCPPVQDMAIMVQGTGYCGDHDPGDVAGPDLLVSHQPLSPSLIAAARGR